MGKIGQRGQICLEFSACSHTIGSSEDLIKHEPPTDKQLKNGFRNKTGENRVRREEGDEFCLI